MKCRIRLPHNPAGTTTEMQLSLDQISETVGECGESVRAANRGAPEIPNVVPVVQPQRGPGLSSAFPMEALPRHMGTTHKDAHTKPHHELIYNNRTIR
jgi:hypothetical protein